MVDKMAKKTVKTKKASTELLKQNEAEAIQVPITETLEMENLDIVIAFLRL